MFWITYCYKEPKACFQSLQSLARLATPEKGLLSGTSINGSQVLLVTASHSIITRGKKRSKRTWDRLEVRKATHLLSHRETREVFRIACVFQSPPEHLSAIIRHSRCADPDITKRTAYFAIDRKSYCCGQCCYVDRCRLCKNTASTSTSD